MSRDKISLQIQKGSDFLSVFIPRDTRIKSVSGRQIFDSRGNPTVCARVVLACGAAGEAAVPSGASTGKFEAHELRDGGGSYNGKGVLRAVENIEADLEPAVRGMDAVNQQSVDNAMLALDTTGRKTKLGANAVLAVSLAAAHAAAKAYAMPLYRWLGGQNGCKLPVPMMNILNGGAHASNNVDIQEFMIVPSGAHDFAEAMKMSTEIYHALGKLLRSRGMSTAVGDEGGFAPDLSSDEKALELICDAIAAAGYEPGTQVSIALDAAAGEWQSENGYHLPKSGKNMTAGELTEYFARLSSDYPIISIEDPLGQDDFEGFAAITKRLRGVQIVGDDLFVTNTERLHRGIETGSANAILIKPNQIGTLSETLHTIRMAQEAGYSTVISHRSGETEDTTIADLAVAVNSGQIKTGAPARSDRVAKYNRLLAIEQELRCGYCIGS